jgi:hypothetical protein
MYMGAGQDEVCSKCGDTNVVAKDLKKTKVDYYTGDKPFEEKKADDSVPDLLKWFKGD